MLRLRDLFSKTSSDLNNFLETPITDLDFFKSSFPKYDLEKTDSTYEYHFDLPGVSNNEVTVEIKDDKLVVSGERKRTNTKENSNYTLTESYSGTFVRKLALENDASVNNVTAKMNNGVLSVSVPRNKQPTYNNIIPIN